MDTWSTNKKPAAESIAVLGFSLKVARGPDKGRTVTADGPELTVGTSAANQLVLTDATVSRNHLVLEAAAEGVRVRDLGSTNGTFTGGVRIYDAVVRDGADLEVGETTLRLSLARQPVDVPLYPGESFGPMLGRSSAMRLVFATLDRVARTDATVLLLGESGTGKDLAAEAVHAASARSAAPFVVVDCGAIAENLIESELFGHEKGAFTGAAGRRAGAFEAAQGGTVFLDEIGELPLSLQPKLLRVLERRTVKPVGGNEPQHVDVRFIAATNRDLRAEVNRGGFREDLFYRLSVISVRLPALRERRDDLPLLAEGIAASMPGKPSVPDSVSARFATHDWPGNVRELRHAIEGAVMLGDAHLGPVVRGADSSPTATDADPEVPFKVAKQRVVERFERGYLAALVESCQGNVSAAARKAGIDRVHLLKLLRRYGLR